MWATQHEELRPDSSSHVKHPDIVAWICNPNAQVHIQADPTIFLDSSLSLMHRGKHKQILGAHWCNMTQISEKISHTEGNRDTGTYTHTRRVNDT